MVEVNNICMSYGKRQVLQDISFHIEKGTIVGLLGSNGAGKSTTMNILTGYMKPTSGEVTIDGIHLQKNPKEAKRKIGYLPEIPPVYKDMRVWEYLKFVANLKGIKDKSSVDEVMELVGISDRDADFIKNLSKGYQQRVGFAQALLGKPSILILDEPFVGLDPEESKLLRKLVLELRENRVIIISSHILTEIEELCNEILMIKDGHIVLEDSTKDAKQRGKQNIYRFVIKGKREDVDKCLNEFDGLKSIRFVREKEPLVYEYIGTAKNNRDIRDNILSYLVSKKLIVYGVDRDEASLEDVFIEMNRKEEE